LVHIIIFGFYFSNASPPNQGLSSGEDFGEKISTSRTYPRIEGEVKGMCSAVNEVRDKNFRQVVIRDLRGLTIPALFNCESGEKMLPYLDRLELGEVQSFYFKKGEKGSFLKSIYPLSVAGGNYAGLS
jgi:hypothetical protein